MLVEINVMAIIRQSSGARCGLFAVQRVLAEVFVIAHDVAILPRYSLLNRRPPVAHADQPKQSCILSLCLI
jgi:hypothetical protein